MNRLKIIINTAVLCFTWTALCFPANINSSRYADSLFINPELHQSWSNLLNHYEVSMRGKIEFDRNFEKVLHLEPDAELRIRHRYLFTTREIIIRGDERGEPQYRFRINGRERTSAEEAQEWLTHILPEIAEKSSFGAKIKARQLLTSKGPAQFLQELRYLSDGDHADVYLEVFFSETSLSADLVTQGILKISDATSSDSERRSLLKQAISFFPEDITITSAMLSVIHDMESDFEVREALITLSRERKFSQINAVDVGKIITHLQSDFEKTSAISGICQNLSGENSLWRPLVESATSIENSFERRKIIDYFLETAPADVVPINQLFNLASGIDNSFDKSEALLNILPHMPKVFQKDFINIAATIESDYDRKKTLVALAESGINDVEVLRGALEIIREMSSDFEQSRCLETMSKTSAMNKASLDHWLEAWTSIGSDYEKSQSLTVLLDKISFEQEDLRKIAKNIETQIESEYEKGKLHRLISQKIIGENNDI